MTVPPATSSALIASTDSPTEDTGTYTPVVSSKTNAPLLISAAFVASDAAFTSAPA